MTAVLEVAGSDRNREDVCNPGFMMLSRNYS